MQEAIPFRTYVPATTTIPTKLLARNHVGDSSASNDVNFAKNIRSEIDYVRKLVGENSVIIFGRRGCCMCHVVKRLLQGLGANPTVLEVEENDEAYVINELSRIEQNGVHHGQVQFPVVFIGGKLFGGLERVMSTHISGELVPVLKDAGALWL